MLHESVISKGSRVTLHFSLALTSGELIDSNFDREPASCRIGDGSLLPGFEARLMGMRLHQEVEVTVPAAEAFGAPNADNIHRLPRDRFAMFLDDEFDALEPGAVVSFKDAAGFDLPGVIKEKSAAGVLVDFNHPLAGRDIVFRARIVGLLDDDTEAVEIGI